MYADSTGDLLVRTPLVTREEISQAVSDEMERDPREISRYNEVLFITIAGVCCVVIFTLTAMLMEHPKYAARIRSALLLPPPPLPAHEQPQAVWADTPGAEG